jgi:hypothetical protein
MRLSRLPEKLFQKNFKKGVDKYNGVVISYGYKVITTS